MAKLDYKKWNTYYNLLMDKSILDIPEKYYFNFAISLRDAQVICLTIDENSDLNLKKFLLSKNIPKAIEVSKKSKNNSNIILAKFMSLDSLKNFINKCEKKDTENLSACNDDNILKIYK